MARLRHALCLAIVLAFDPAPSTAGDIFDLVEHGYADSGGVQIHYVTRGRGPLIVMLHGFPDFWYGWRQQIPLLARRHQVAALDLRGYNLSDHPEGVDQYGIGYLINDVAAVIHDLGHERAIIIGHDWGGGIAWAFASLYPQMTEALIVLQTPHPRGLLRELRTNPEQQARSAYARRFQEGGAHLTLNAEGLASLVRDPVARVRYVEAFQRSDFEAMLNYYKANYPRAPYNDIPLPNVQAPVLIIHGMGDPFLLPAGHNSTWDWVDGSVSVETVPTAGHFIMEDQPDLVTRTIYRWLRERRL